MASTGRLKFDNESQSSAKISKSSYRYYILGIFLLFLSFAIGLLIGHFAIEKDSSDDSSSSGTGVFLPGVPEAIIREADPAVSEWIMQELSASNIKENLRLV